VEIGTSMAAAIARQASRLSRREKMPTSGRPKRALTRPAPVLDTNWKPACCANRAL
jgi:hypothetical protein